MKTTTLLRIVTRTALAASALSLAACSLDKQEMPALSGPSTFGMSVSMVASPDHLPRDGSSQSVVVLTVRDAKGQGVSGQHVSLSVTAGALTQTDVVTGAGGLTSFGVVAPDATTVIAGNQLVISATPVRSGDAANTTTQRMSIGLSGSPNETEPTPDFTFTPLAPEINQVVTFDASSTQDEHVPCKDACTYDWNFDDGATASGRLAAHQFAVARPYSVALTVTDASGVAVTVRKIVTPFAPAAPTVVISVIPTAPLVNQQATFIVNAKAAPNHSVVRFDWSFGDGSTATTTAANVDHTFTSAGTFAVTVRATDDLGQVGAGSLPLSVGSATTATFSVSPTAPASTDTVHFDASGSTTPNGTTIVSYQWDWGDGTSEVNTVPTASHVFATNTWVVKLTITDSLGGTGSKSQNLVIK